MLHLPWPHKHGSWFSRACSSAEMPTALKHPTFLNIAGMEKTSFRSVQSLLNRRFHGNMCGEFIVRSSIHPMKFPSEKKKTAHVHHVHPIFPESFQKFPVRKTPKKKRKKKRKMSSSQRQPSPGAPGRRALLLLHFFGGLLGHLQVRLEAGFGGSQWIMMDYDMIYIYILSHIYI